MDVDLFEEAKKMYEEKITILNVDLKKLDVKYQNEIKLNQRFQKEKADLQIKQREVSTLNNEKEIYLVQKDEIIK